MVLTCRSCSCVFNTNIDLQRHRQNHHENEPSDVFLCGHCNSTFTLAKNLVRHLKRTHNFVRYLKCGTCPTFFGNSERLQLHCQEYHNVNETRVAQPPRSIGNAIVHSDYNSVRGHFRTLRFKFQENEENFDPFEFMVTNETQIIDCVNSAINDNAARFSICLEIIFEKPLQQETTSSYFNSKMVTSSTLLTSEEYYTHVDQILTQINIFCTAGSGWVVQTLSKMDLKFCHFNPLRPGTYIPTPEKLKTLRRSLLNIKNKQDGFCFIYCIAAAIFPVTKNQERPQNYTAHMSKFKFDRNKMPMPLSSIPVFERNNDLKINVYSFENNKMYPVYLSKQKKGGKTRKTIHLLLLCEDNKAHYCLIKSLDRVLKTMLRSRRTATSKNNERKFCERCLQSVNKQKLDQHKELCADQQPHLIEMPAEGTTVKFKNWQKKYRSPFVVYADLEAFDVRTDGFEDMRQTYSETLNDAKAATLIIEHQYPCSFGAVLVDARRSGAAKSEYFRGDNPIAKMMDTFRDWLRWAAQEKQRYRFLKWSTVKREKYIDSWNFPCCICNEPFADHIETDDNEGNQQHTTENDDDENHPDDDDDGGDEPHQSTPNTRNKRKVIHHCHLTGKVFGVAHSGCNLKCTTTNFLPVFFHNLSRYDAHHIIKNLKLEEGEELTAISRTEENFISFSVRVPVGTYMDRQGNEKNIKHDIRFLDSLNFMTSGLDSLVKTLDDSDLRLLREEFGYLSDENFALIRKKGFFPYSYLDGPEKFQSGLPDYGVDWMNTLSGKIDISRENYLEVKKVYNLFKCQNFGDYHDLYLKLDVLLLADVFERFRDVCEKVYELDPVYFYSAPNLSWEAMLATTGVKIELLNDYDMLLFCEKAIRGGINGIGSLRYFEANNKHLENYNPQKPSIYGAFFDVTSLYAGTMMKPLPLNNFRWVDQISEEDIMNYSETDEYAFFIEVDLEYPHSMHDSHQDLPLAPEKLFIKNEWLSDYSAQFKEKRAQNCPPKLVETLFDKEKYVCHVNNLQFYVKNGLKIKKIYRALQFRQTQWLKPYIEKNTVMRKKASSAFEKNFYKLMSNACFGKTMENKRNRRQIFFVADERRANFLTNKPNFKSFQIISENLTSVYMTQPTIFWDKPTPVGAAILDLSKLSLYGFHYNEIKPRYGSRALVTYKDTDSLLYRIETDDLYEDMSSFKHLLDLSDYPTDHPLYDATNKKVPLTMTDELNGKVMQACTILRSKMYSIKYQDGLKQSARGVSHSVKKSLHHDNFTNCLFDGVSKRAPMTRIHSDNHQITVSMTNKVALSCFDDKRYILANGIDTLPHGHFSLEQNKANSDDNQEATENFSDETTSSSDGNDTDCSSSSTHESMVHPKNYDDDNENHQVTVSSSLSSAASPLPTAQNRTLQKMSSPLRHLIMDVYGNKFFVQHFC